PIENCCCHFPFYLLKLRLRDAPVPRTCPWIRGGGEIRTRGPVRDAGFQDRWFQPLTHPSDNVFNYLGYAPCFCLSIRLSICEVPKASATSPPLEIDVPPILVSNDRLCASDGRCSS